MKHNLRKFIPLLFLAVISFAVILPSAVFVAPQPVYAAPGDPATPAATPAAPAKPPAAPAATVESSWIGNMVLSAVSAIIQFVVNALGLLTIALIHILLLVAGYNSYMDSPAITTGWIVVRDVANLFFVAIILVVSIGSIVNPERFGGVKKVFRILLFAILVNFSRTIAGLFIDISQLVMLTFVNGFAQAAGGNFVEALGISKINSVAPGTAALSFASMLGAYILSLLMMIIITVIIAVLVVALTVRMVTLWMLVVLSPLAFALGASDMTHEHYATWWKKFSAELTTGPIVAFFLWLSLVSFQNSHGSDVTGTELKDTSAAGNENTSVDCGPTDSCSQENLIRFIVASCMLLMGLGFAKEFSGVGGSLAGAAMSKGKKYAQGALNYGVKKTTWAAGKAAPVAAGALVGGPIGAGIVLAARSSYGKAALTRGKAVMGQSLAGGNKVGNRLSTVPVLGRLTTRVGMAFSASANKDYAEKTKKADENIKGALPRQLVAMSMGHGVDKATEMAAKVAAASKATKDTGWDDAAKSKALNEAESYFKSAGNKSGLDEIEKQRKKNPLLVDALEPATDGSPRTKREQFVQKMSGSDLVELDPKSIEEIAGFMTPNQREHIKKNGGAEREHAVDAWEAGHPPTPDKLASDLKTGTQRPDDVNAHSLENVDIAVRLSADDLKGKLNEILKTPAKKESFRRGVTNALNSAPNDRIDAATGRYTPGSQQAAEGLVRAGGNIRDAFRVDSSGGFTNVSPSGADTSLADQNAFMTAMRGSNYADVAFGTDPALLAPSANNFVKRVMTDISIMNVGRLNSMRQSANGNADQLKVIDALASAMHEAFTRRAAVAGPDQKKYQRQVSQLEDNYSV